uniref:OCIA domain-containing protein n=1 Tax=Globodera pallida TaxID=36090 RepID=A0A183BPV5_GLOPA
MNNYPTESGGNKLTEFSSVLSDMFGGSELGKLNRGQFSCNLSTDDMIEVNQMIEQCTRKCAITYGGPLAAVSIGFLEFMRRHKQKLPITSPRYLIGYPVLVLTSAVFGASFGLKRSTCGSEIRQHFVRLYTKYDALGGDGAQGGDDAQSGDGAQMATGSVGSSPLKSYSQLRDANRSGRLGQAVKPQQQRLQQQQKTAPVVDGTGTPDGHEGWGNYGLDGLFKPPPENGGQSSSLPSPPKSF